MKAPDTGSIAAKYSTEGFGLNHLPYASFTPPNSNQPRLGIRIGDHVISTADAVGGAEGVTPALKEAADGSNLDLLLAAGRSAWDELRLIAQNALSDGQPAARLHALLHPVDEVTLHLPFTVADYVDFYGNEHHASNVGHIFRPGQPPLTPNWKHIPIGYHGRAGTIVPTGTPVPRPKGMRPETDDAPSFGPSRRLDIEAEVGFVLGGTAPIGGVQLSEAGNHIFGLVMTNDWSARDIQAFEYVPLGPNLGKSFATSIAAWVTPVAALEAARIRPPSRDTPLAPYLDDNDTELWGFDVHIEVVLNGQIVSRPSFASTYWTAAQMLAHMTVNGAGLRPGDFFAGGTVSGPTRGERGSFLEIVWGGKDPLVLEDGNEFTFLRDGDEVTLRATAKSDDGEIIRFGECTGRILPAA